jgi:signal transduction histidine kinase/CheY-like chemotaxis protein
MRIPADRTAIYDKDEISLVPICIVVLALTAPLVFWSDFVSKEVVRSRVEWLIISIYGLCIVTIFLERRWRDGGRWLFLVGLAAILIGTAAFLPAPAFLALVFIPLGLSCFFFGMRSAVYMAVGITATILFGAALDRISWMDGVIAIIALAVTYAMLYALVHPLSQTSAWVDEYYQKGEAYWKEARDNQEKLFQTLEELTHANEQLQRMNILAQNLRQEAEEARRTKEAFVGNVSHELRTPLNMVIGFSEHIVKNPQTYGGKLPPALLADLSVIYRNASHLSGLIDDILDLSQIELRQMALSRSWVDLREIVDDALTVIKPLYVGKKISLTAHLDPDLPQVYCDPLRIREVLVNLLSNAGRFTEQGGVTLTASRGDQNLFFKVQDTGLGIKQADLSRLFQPFQQLDNSIRRRYGGTGLGLNISKNFVEMHGGKIWVESEEGVGTTFYFTLPDLAAEQTRDAATRWISPDWEYRQRSAASSALPLVVRPRFLVLEKGSILRRLLMRYYDVGEYVGVSSFAQVSEEMANNPAKALYINEESVAAALTVCNQPNLLPKGLPVMICSIPEKLDALRAFEDIEIITKPISREKLAGVLERTQIDSGTVLVVDDQVDALHLYSRILASMGGRYSVVQASDGEEAVSILSEFEPDLILLDLVMPGMDGFQFLEHLHRENLLKNQKIAVVSAFDMPVQPILIDSVGLTRGGGLSLAQFLESVKAVSRVFELPD